MVLNSSIRVLLEEFGGILRTNLECGRNLSAQTAFSNQLHQVMRVLRPFEPCFAQQERRDGRGRRADPSMMMSWSLSELTKSKSDKSLL